MGNDLALAVLSDRRRLAVQLLQAAVRAGHEPADRLDPRAVRDEPAHRHRPAAQPARRDSPSTPATRADNSRSCATSSSSGCGVDPHDAFNGTTIDIDLVRRRRRGRASRRALARIRAEAIDALAARTQHPRPLRPRASSAERVPIPSLLAVGRCTTTSSREGTRLQAGLVVESGEPREVHHLAALIGYGASRDQPLPDARDASTSSTSPPSASGTRSPRRQRDARSPRASARACSRSISKMGISTIRSYRGAQIFEAVGLDQELVDRALHRHAVAHRRHRARRARRARRSPATPAPIPVTPRRDLLPVGGLYAVAARRRAPPCGTRRRSPAAARRPRRDATARSPTRSTAVAVNEENASLRHAPRTVQVPRARGAPIPLEEVEPASRDRQALLDRRDEPRLDLAGGPRDARDRDEPPRRPRPTRARAARTRRRYTPDPNGDQRRSRSSRSPPAASASTSTTSSNADELQIKMAQGAKPGEGGQLPGHKVDEYIGSRPAHDAGRRPDLAAAAPRHLLDRGPQAADLRPALRQPDGRASRSSSSPRSGSARSPRASPRPTPTTCSSPATTAAPAHRRCRRSKHAGVPWEIGLAETQQTLLRNDLRIAHHRCRRTAS